jgi:MFS family permease
VPLDLGRVLRTADFARLYVSGIALSVAVFVPFVFLAPFARDHGLSGLQAASLIGLMGGVSVVGRLGLAGLGNRWHLLRTYRACLLGLGASMIVWLLSDGSYLGLAGFAALFGLAQGGWISLMPAVVARLYGAAGLGRLLGLLYTAGGIGALVGPPLAGATIDLADSYTPALVLAAVLAFGGFAVFRGVGAEPRQPAAGRRSRWTLWHPAHA